MSQGLRDFGSRRALPSRRALSTGTVLLLIATAACSGAPASSTSDTTPGTPGAPVTLNSAAAMIAPEAFAIGPDGHVYFSDCLAQRVFRLESNGHRTVVAGSGPEGQSGGGFSGDGGPAVRARLNCPGGLAFDRQGSLYVSDALNNRVRMIDPSGTITTVAGSGSPGLNYGPMQGDGGPATKATLEFPVGIALDRSGNLYIADKGHDTIRKVTSSGVITTIAGTGVGGYSGDGGPATKAQLHGPWYLVIDPRGNLYFTERENDLVRRVDTHGMITTIAGGGRAPKEGDGGSAIHASFKEAYGLARDAKGNLYVSDDLANVIRRIDAHGIISTVAGNGKRGRGGDGGPAIQAELNTPFGLVVDPVGDLLVADGGNGCVRKIDLHGTITSVVCAR
jgi:trimeric autotransporter adhesin